MVKNAIIAGMLVKTSLSDIPAFLVKSLLGEGEETKQLIKRAKSHQLIVGISRRRHTFYDITNLGMELLTEYNKAGEED